MRNHDAESRIEKLADALDRQHRLSIRQFEYEEERSDLLFDVARQAQQEHDLGDESAEYLRWLLRELCNDAQLHGRSWPLPEQAHMCAALETP